MPHRRCRKSSAMFLCGVLVLFFWQSTIYPVSGQTGSETIEGLAAKVETTQKLEQREKLEQNQIVIQKGDTLWSLAQKYQLSLEQLTQINHIAYPDLIRVGQKIIIQAQAPSQAQVFSQFSELSQGRPPIHSQMQTTQALNVEEVKTFEIMMEDSENSLHPSRGQQTQERVLKEQNAKEQNAKEQNAKEQNAKEQNAKEQNAKEQNAKEQNAKEQNAKEQTPEEQTLKVKVSQGDIDLLARVIYAEARGEDFEGQVAVGAVVLNRLEGTGFPKTIHGVVYQPGAFTAVLDKQIHLTPNEEAYRAAETALAGEDPTGGALYYFNPKTATDNWIKSRAVIKQIGNHTFSI